MQGALKMLRILARRLSENALLPKLFVINRK